ncbi:histidine kinase [Sphingomonas canadensis]|uniref:histidine kinase n=1 Tax=Sphingomonas canadensis TaxID=1219257 RepID=A0ABW3H1T7_9SPHN|nr:sensor histidine kinase [Sphingomonas canadensis]MCW3834674.1 sensor histidine kinase [Sphingomonas canadensis]
MTWLLWNPRAISYLAQLVLVLAVAGYLLRRSLAERGTGRLPAAQTLIFATAVLFVPVVVLWMLRVALVPGLQAYVLPWTAPFSSMTLAAMIQLAYRFPAPLEGARIEARLALAVSGACVAGEAAVAVWRFRDTLEGAIWFRPAWMDLGLVGGFGWIAILLIRQILQATRGEAGGERGIARRLFSGGGRDGAAARAYFLFALLPLAHAGALMAHGMGLTSVLFTEIAVCWLSLAQIAGFALIYLNHLPDRSSFLVKLSGVSITAILAVISSLAWLIGPVYIEAYQNRTMVAERQAYRFHPDGQGGYWAERVPYLYDHRLGERIAGGRAEVPLPFAFPFYGRNHKRIFVREDGLTGFDRLPLWRETAHLYGPQPAIFPLAVELGGNNGEAIAPGSGVFVSRYADKVLISWHALRETENPANRYSFQLALYPDGAIEFAYDRLPARPRYDLYLANATAWLIGITPGSNAGPVQRIDLRGVPLHGAPGSGMMSDYYLDFLRYLDRIYAPIAWFLLAVIPLILLGLPVFLRVNLVVPLNRLLRGVERFRRGSLDARVPVTFADEIGYLTSSFNDMASEQHALVNTLEDRVTERTEEAAEFAARNARLEERNRLSGDLHDSVSQTLFSAAMVADSLPEQWQRSPQDAERALERLSQLNRHALAEMRLLLTELRTGTAEQRPLGELIVALARAFEANQGVATQVEIVGDAKLPGEVQAMFHRIAQESLNNIAKHAGARNVRVTFEGLPGQALLVIGDDGRGFDPAAVVGDHLGLQIMRERAQRIGASLEIDAAPGRGTIITLIWMASDER